MATHLFTSESVSEGHPDKIADQISDAVLDAILEQDPKARVACETYVKTGMVMVGGEITTSAWVDIEEITRKTVREIGYTSSEMGFDANSCAVLSAIGKQSPDINQGVDRIDPSEQGAGDQGLMFGYATNETDVLMPAPITYAHRLVQRQADVRKNGTLPWLRPDAKSQVTFQYDNNKIVGIDAVVLSTQHSEEIQQKDLHEAVMEEIIKPVLPAEWLSSATKYFINPTGRFVIGISMGDCGLTGTVKSSLIHTVVWLVMVVVLFLVKTLLKSTAPRLMLHAMLRKILWLQGLQTAARSKFLMLLVSLSQPLLWSKHLVRLK